MRLEELADQYRIHLAVLTIAEEVERISGKAVDARPTPGLDVRARTKMARAGMPHHVVLFSPKERPHLSHLLAHELARILRTFETPAHERWIPVSTADTLRRARDEMRPETHFVPPVSRDRFQDAWIHGLVMQVTSQPIDVRVERWLRENYPGLRERQVRSLRTEMGVIVASISPEVERATPPGIFRRSKAMNYAYLKDIGEIMGRSFDSHFRDAPEIVAQGMTLSALFENDTLSDHELVTQCAEALDIRDWFVWKGFEDVPPSYCTQGAA